MKRGIDWNNKEEVKKYRNKYMKVWRKSHRKQIAETGRKSRIKNIKKIRATDIKRHKKQKDFILSYKKERSCSKCGYKEHTEILQFHHNKNDKSFCVAEKIHCSKEKLLPEIKKCILLCPNCHFLIHSTRKYGRPRTIEEDV